ncbi:peptide ABC transporter substrate-binding protein [Vagococcus sp. JNUCC 83]
MKKKLGLMISIVSVIFISGCSTTKKSESKKSSDKMSINMMLNSELSSLNTSAILNTPDTIIHTGVFEGLYELNDKEELVPAVAKELPEISENGLKYTIKLRDNAKWSNGDSVKAQDFEFSWKELINPDRGYVYSFLMVGIIKNAKDVNEGKLKVDELGVRAIDDYTLEVDLEKPTPYFTSLLAFSPFFPQNKTVVEEYGKDYGTSSEKVVYNGPFVAKDWNQAKTTVKLEKNKDYWDAKEVKADEINFEVIKEPSTAFNLFESGELDIANLSGVIANQNKNNQNFEAHPSSTMNYIRLNQKRDNKETALSNENLRKALALSVDKETLVNNIISDGSTVLNGAIIKGFAYNPETKEDFRDEAGDLMKYDKTKAQEYFKKAQTELGDKITLELMTVDENSYKQMAENLKGQWEETLDGIEITVKSLPTETALNISNQSDYDMFLIYWTPDYQDPISTLNTMKSPNNRNYANKEVDDLLEKASNDNNLAQRWDYLIKAEKIIMEDTAGMIVISQNANAVLKNNDIKGLTYHTFAAPVSVKYLSK